MDGHIQVSELVFFYIEKLLYNETKTNKQLWSRNYLFLAQGIQACLMVSRIPITVNVPFCHGHGHPFEPIPAPHHRVLLFLKFEFANIVSTWRNAFF